MIYAPIMNRNPLGVKSPSTSRYQSQPLWPLSGYTAKQIPTNIWRWPLNRNSLLGYAGQVYYQLNQAACGGSFSCQALRASVLELATREWRSPPDLGRMLARSGHWSCS